MIKVAFCTCNSDVKQSQPFANVIDTGSLRCFTFRDATQTRLGTGHFAAGRSLQPPDSIDLLQTISPKCIGRFAYPTESHSY